MIHEFRNRDGTISEKTAKYYANILAYAEKYDLRNTRIALDLAVELHDGQFRDGGAPYIIHPLEATHYLILLGIWHPIFEMHLFNLHDEKLAQEYSHIDLDNLLSAELLHDVCEDCSSKLPKNGDEFVTEYQLNPDILSLVRCLSKDKTTPGYTIDGYFEKIGKSWQTALMKTADRLSNCSTIDAFNTKRMEKYIRENVNYFYPMLSHSKEAFCEFSQIFTIMKYLIVSISETIASLLGLEELIKRNSYTNAYYFIKGVAVSKKMVNTQKALPLAAKYYDGLQRKSGDPLILHPLRVCSYLLSLNISNDEMCAAAILHEIINRCNLPCNGVEILTKYHLNPKVLDYIRLLANSEHYPLETYYSALIEYPEVLLLKLSNRAHTCTTLINSSTEEIKKYVDECESFLYPLCEYGMKHYPQYSNQIQLMYYHISSICNIVKHLKLYS